jgi:hypothetical protein
MLSILKTFPPDEYLKIRGNRLKLSKKLCKLSSSRKPFTSKDTAKNIAPEIIEKLRKNKLIKEGTESGSFKFVTDVSRELIEFLGTTNCTRRGRVGFAKYMSHGTKTVILWHCLCYGKSIHLDEVKRITSEFDAITQRKVSNRQEYYLGQLEKGGCLKRVTSCEFQLNVENGEKKIFTKLISGYKTYAQPETLLRDFIQVVAQQHAEFSGKVIHEELVEMKIPHHPTSVYKEILKMVKDDIFEDPKETRPGKDGRGLLKIYRIKFKDAQKQNTENIETIKEAMEHYEYCSPKKPENKDAWNRFSKFAMPQEPNVIEVFLRELRWGYLLRGVDQTSSIAFWLSFLHEFQNPRLFEEMHEICWINDENSPMKDIEEISKKYRVSPLAVALLYSAMSFEARMQKGEDETSRTSLAVQFDEKSCCHKPVTR